MDACFSGAANRAPQARGLWLTCPCASFQAWRPSASHMRPQVGLTHIPSLPLPHPPSHVPHCLTVVLRLGPEVRPGCEPTNDAGVVHEAGARRGV